MTTLRDTLRAVPLFSDLSEDDLDRLAAGAFTESAPAGTVIFQEGDDGDRACVITAGEVEVVKASGPREILLAVRKPGDVVGEMSLLDAAPRMASVRTRTDSTFLTIPKQQMDDLLRNSATASRSLFNVLLSRWRETESSLRQSERMAQIGTLTAGLAHEMNNPAAAIRRGAAQLAEALDGFGDRSADLRGTDLTPEAQARVDALLEVARQTPEPLGALERADRETALERTVAALGVPDPWTLVPVLAAARVEPADLTSALADLSPEQAAVALRAFCALADTTSLLREIEQGAERLSAIVGALKSYSYLDQAEVQEVEVRKGLDDTLLILKHKLGGIETKREYQPEPHRIQAYAGELNQAWTNLIDNAADALLEADTTNPLIIVRVYSPGEGVVVEIEDNGPGIAPDSIDRIFDAFYTTKAPGSGTGLGLDITYGTVVHRHGGEISVESGPGRTVFRVSLPDAPR